ncbi:MAG TPA: M48 family metallopeptidase [Roseiarcus sp.]|nr:M48 family metallopeptidase [Roseiarcus sp.]
MGPPIEGEAVYFDGLLARRHAARVRLGDRLSVLEGDAVLDDWSYADIRRADGAPGALRLRSLAARELARLDISDTAVADAVAARCPALDEDHAIGRRGGLRKILFWSLAAAVSIVLMAIYGAPLAADRIIPLIPYSLEQRFGDAAANQVAVAFGKSSCTGAGGLAALRKLSSLLAVEGDLRVRIETSVLDSRVANAFALPGGRVFILRGLLDKAQSPDELAGVLAHELGHFAHRDGLREMIASGGAGFLFSLLLGDVSGSGAVIVAGRALIASAYSRDAEASADAFAGRIMRGLGRSPRPLGEFLMRMTGAEQGGMLASHPLSQDRLAVLKAADAPTTGPALLTDDEWRAIKGICD